MSRRKLHGTSLRRIIVVCSLRKRKVASSILAAGSSFPIRLVPFLCLSLTFRVMAAQASGTASARDSRAVVFCGLLCISMQTCLGLYWLSYKILVLRNTSSDSDSRCSGFSRGYVEGESAAPVSASREELDAKSVEVSIPDSEPTNVVAPEVDQPEVVFEPELYAVPLSTLNSIALRSSGNFHLDRESYCSYRGAEERQHSIDRRTGQRMDSAMTNTGTAVDSQARAGQEAATATIGIVRTEAGEAEE
ncbi:hypothetical protein MLD38_037955 [Melastoma candidum]|uniref:Uncharacterized protein n=1 Tax=Melastoma candidum TaxID=119954 RepID=A0ACB9KYJ2_9MYRT|nr:hypothetical protein MLD38_037955 [Melastoma candidum]